MRLRGITTAILIGLSLLTFNGGSAEALTEHNISSDLTISINSATAKPGDKFKIDVSLANVPSPGISVCEFGIDYNPMQIKITNVTEGAVSKGTGAAKAELSINPKLGEADTYSCFNYHISKKDGQICVSWLTGMANTNYWIKSDGVLFTIEGIVTAEDAGTATLSVEPIHRKDYPNALVFNQRMIFGYRDLNFETYDEYFYTYKATSGKVKITNPNVTLTGDLNLDNQISVIDVMLLSQYICKQNTLSAQQLLNADMNSDGRVNVQDLVMLTKRVLNKE